MKKHQRLHKILFLLSVVTLLWALFLPAPGPAGAESASEGGSGQMLAIQDGQEKSIPLPLKKTRVEAHIAGIVTTVRVIQEFGNPYSTPVEAVYVFPLPQHAAVNAMKMIIGERVIEGKIKGREEARELYNQAKRQGKTASLLDQERPNIFTQSVANIMPGDDIRVELSYFHDLPFEKGQYEFVFPMVVGPRYIPGGASGQRGKGWAPDTTRVPDGSRISPPLLPPGIRSGHDIALQVDLDTGVPFRELETPSHAIQLVQKTTSRAMITLSPQDRIPNKDFILRWKVAQKGPVAGWLAHKGPEGGYFFMLLQPEVEISRAETAAREYIFVIDTSGSMHGFPLDQCKRIVTKCLNDLRPDDRFQVILFAGSASMLAPAPLSATETNIQKALGYVKKARGGGGTEFLPALEKALDGPVDPDRSRIVLFLSDGYIGYEAEVLKYMDQHRGKANIFPLGVGSSVNRYLIDAMARIGQGEPFYLTPDEAPEPVVDRFFKYVSRPALTHIEVQFKGITVSALQPAALPDLFAGRPLSLVGKYTKGGRGKVVLTGWLAGKPWKQILKVDLPDKAQANPGLAGLWARRRIESLSDRLATGALAEDRAREDITSLALQYHLMSAYTSFVAIDSQVRNPDGTSQTIVVPVPLPDQVSPLAAPAQAYKTSFFCGGAVSRGRNNFLSRKTKTGYSSALSLGHDRVVKEEAEKNSPVQGKPCEDFSLEEVEEKGVGPRIEIKEMKIRGAINEEAVRRTLLKAIKSWCRSGDMADLRGTIILSLEVLASGKIHRAWIPEKEQRPTKVFNRLEKKAKRLLFPPAATKSYIHLKLVFK